MAGGCAQSRESVASAYAEAAGGYAYGGRGDGRAPLPGCLPLCASPRPFLIALAIPPGHPRTWEHVRARNTGDVRSDPPHLQAMRAPGQTAHSTISCLLPRIALHRVWFAGVMHLHPPMFP
eukprot:7661125-Pyramimonas_sp.AAC.1